MWLYQPTPRSDFAACLLPMMRATAKLRMCLILARSRFVITFELLGTVPAIDTLYLQLRPALIPWASSAAVLHVTCVRSGMLQNERRPKPLAAIRFAISLTGVRDGHRGSGLHL